MHFSKKKIGRVHIIYSSIGTLPTSKVYILFTPVLSFSEGAYSVKFDNMCTQTY